MAADTRRGSDAAPVDAPVIDLPPPPEGLFDPNIAEHGPLAEAMTCGLTERGAIAASLRFVSCTEDVEGLTNVTSLLLMHRIGAMGLPSGWFDVAYNCAYWRCAAAAGTCSELAECAAAESCEVDAEGMPTETEFCDGDFANTCRRQGIGRQIGMGPVRSRTNCAAFSGSCSEGNCVFPLECEYPGFSEEACDGDRLTYCGGTLALDCRSLAGTTCSSFYQEGELPTLWCGESTAGLYGYRDQPPGVCDGTIHIPDRGFVKEAVGADLRIDCLEFGYERCTPRGCE